MIEEFNITVFKYINHLAGINPVLDGIVKIGAQYLPFVFIFWLLYLWLKHDDKYKNIVLYSIYSVSLGLLLNLLISLFYFHPRPFMIPVGEPLIQHKPDASFPSDHTTFMLSIAFMLSYFKETKISGLILLVLGLMGGLARIFCGLHFPLDIIGSLGVGLLSSFLIYLLQNKLGVLNRFIVNLMQHHYNKAP